MSLKANVVIDENQPVLTQDEYSPKVQALKDAHPGSIVVEFSDGAVAAFSRPSRHVTGLALLNNRDRGPMSMVDTLLTNCFVAGDAEVKTDPTYVLPLVNVADQIISGKSAEVKN